MKETPTIEEVTPEKAVLALGFLPVEDDMLNLASPCTSERYAPFGKDELQEASKPSGVQTVVR